DDLADDRGRDDQEPGVVVEPGLVVGQPPGVAEPPPLRIGQQFRRGRLLLDEPPPAGQDGELPVPGIVFRVTFGRGTGCGCAHQRFFASSWALKIPSGITSAIASPLSCCGVSGASPVAGGTGPAGTLLPAAVAARVRAATRRSRADGRRRDLAVPAAPVRGSAGGPWEVQR